MLCAAGCCVRQCQWQGVREWLGEQLGRANRYAGQAAALECKTGEQLCDLTALSCRLTADYAAVQAIAHQQECIGAQPGSDEWSSQPAQCSALE